MAKTAVGQWDTTAANNTDINSIGIQGTNAVSNFDNALRELMAQIATFITGATFTGTTPATLNWADNGATVGPTFTLLRTSTSPAASDIIGRVLFQGKDSAANTQDYAEDDTQIDDATSASEDATRRTRVVVAGTMKSIWSVGAFTGILYSDDAGATVGPILDLYRDSASPAVSDILGSVDFNGRDSAANKQLYARIYSVINDPVSGTEDVSLRLAAVTAGTLVDIVSFTGASITMTGSIADKTWNMAADTDSVAIYGGNAINNGGNIQLYGATHATLANFIKMRSSGAVVYQYDPATGHTFTGTIIGQTAYSGAASAAGMTYSGSSGVMNWAAQAPHTMNRSDPDNTQQSFIVFRRNNTALNGISGTNTTVTYATSSDYRLKFDVVNLPGALDRLMQLRPVRHKWTQNPDVGDVDGFIAHEVQAVVPEAIFGEKDAVYEEDERIGDDVLNKKGDIKPQGGDWAKLVPLLTAALQEAVARIAALETRLADQ